MGEMADYALEEVHSHDELQQRYYAGGMTHEQAEACGMEDQFGSAMPPIFAGRPDAPQSNKTCRCCGASGLSWGRLKGKWRLYAGDELHRCPYVPIKE